MQALQFGSMQPQLSPAPCSASICLCRLRGFLGCVACDCVCINLQACGEGLAGVWQCKGDPHAATARVHGAAWLVSGCSTQWLWQLHALIAACTALLQRCCVHTGYPSWLLVLLGGCPAAG
jgi:hypothetical protein